MIRSLLITGGAGFIASNFIHYWINKYPKDKIIILDLLSYASNINSIKSLIDKRKVIFYKGNIVDSDLVEKILTGHKITHIINFAAESHVDRSINKPSIFLESNILGTFNLLECFKKHWDNNNNPEDWRFLQISTDEVFGSLKLDESPFEETTRYNPRSPYSASKASSDHLVSAWFETYGLPTLITNCSNNYGPFQFPEKLIPLTITNLLRSKEIPLYGDGLNVRDWLFVEDHCCAIDVVLKGAKPGEKYCVGGINEIKNIELIKKICNLIDNYSLDLKLNLKHKNSFDLVKYVKDRPGHDRRYAINTSRIFDKFNWRPKINFDEGLDKTIKWYLENRKWWEPLIKNKT